MIKKLAIGLLILAALCSLLLVAQIKVATYIYDNKMSSILYKIQSKVPGLKLSYKSLDTSFTERKGRIYYNIALKDPKKLGVSNVQGAVDVALAFGPLRVSGALESVPYEGNIEQILRNFNVDPISFKGAFMATAVSPKLEGSLKMDSFILPTSTGLCKFGQNAVAVSATSTEDVDIEFKSAGIACEGALRYSHRPNYRLDVNGLSVTFLPRIVNKKPHFESLVVNLNSLDFKFSTLYFLGFSPEDKVKDLSLQEAISFNNISTAITLSEPDHEGMAKLSFDNSGNYGFAFPYVKNDIEQPFYTLENFKLSGSVERISIPNLVEAAQDIAKNAGEKFDTNKIVSSILAGFSDEIKFVLDQFAYSHEGRGIDISGNSTVAFDMQNGKLKPSKVDSEYKIKANRSLVDELAGNEYRKALETAVANYQISIDGYDYNTVFKLMGKNAYLNNIPLQDLVSQDELLYEEEQRAQRAEAQKQKAERAALEAEIEAAKEAQKSLPSLVEGNLNNQ